MAKPRDLKTSFYLVGIAAAVVKLDLMRYDIRWVLFPMTEGQLARLPSSFNRSCSKSISQSSREGAMAGAAKCSRSSII